MPDDDPQSSPPWRARSHDPSSAPRWRARSVGSAVALVGVAAGLLAWGTSRPGDRSSTWTAHPPSEPLRFLDLSHVKPGQRLIYSVASPDSQRQVDVYTVRQVFPGTSVVKVDFTTEIDDGQGAQFTLGPFGREVTLDPPASDGWTAAVATDERVLIGGVSLEVFKVVDGARTTWFPMRDGRPTFPTVVRTATDGQVTMELVEVKEP